MEEIRYVFDARKQLLMVYKGDHLIGGCFGQIAERQLETLLCTDAKIELGHFLSKKERELLNYKPLNN
jgi:hypothetical protein